MDPGRVLELLGAGVDVAPRHAGERHGGAFEVRRQGHAGDAPALAAAHAAHAASEAQVALGAGVAYGAKRLATMVTLRVYYVEMGGAQ